MGLDERQHALRDDIPRRVGDCEKDVSKLECRQGKPPVLLLVLTGFACDEFLRRRLSEHRYDGRRDAHFERDRLASNALQEARNLLQQLLSLLPVILTADLK